jgi:hypothetical protein
VIPQARHGDREQGYHEDSHVLQNTENDYAEERGGLFERAWSLVFLFFLFFLSADHSFPIILIEKHSE